MEAQPQTGKSQAESRSASPTLCTSMMLAELFGVSREVVKNWVHRGLIHPVGVEGRVSYFDLNGVLSAKFLAGLRNAGFKADEIERKISGLRSLSPNQLLSLSCQNLLVRGKNIFLRQDDKLLEPTGQELLAFVSEEDEPAPVAEVPLTDEEAAMSGLQDAMDLILQANPPKQPSVSIDELRQVAEVMAKMENWAIAEEILRNILFMAGPEADDLYRLGEVLYHRGNLLGAKERLSMAVEMAPDFAEAHTLLGCVLEKLGEHDLADAAFQADEGL